MNLLELRVIRYDEKYNVYWDNKILLSARKTEGFLYKSVGFVDVLQSTPFALFSDRRKLFGENTKTILLYAEKKQLSVSGRGEQCSLQMGNSTYSLYNKLSGGSGFYLDNKQVGRHEILKSDSAGCEMKLTFSEEGFNYKLFVCLLIAIDKS